jgi:hypothetical protein
MTRTLLALTILAALATNATAQSLPDLQEQIRQLQTQLDMQRIPPSPAPVYHPPEWSPPPTPAPCTQFLGTPTYADCLKAYAYGMQLLQQRPLP